MKHFCFVLVALGFLCIPVQSRDLEVQYGWGVGRTIANRSIVLAEPLYMEVFAKMKGAVLGQRGYIGLAFAPWKGMEVIPGLALWHQNGTGKLDEVSPWLRLHVGGEDVRLGAEWALGTVQYHARASLRLSQIMPFDTDASVTLSYEHGPYYEGPMLGLRAHW